MNIKKRINEIDNIVVDTNKERLDLKLNLIGRLLDSVTDSTEEEEVVESLKRVYWIAYEVGSSKAFESANLELSLVKKALEVARKKLPHNKKELLLYLKLNLIYSLNDSVLHNKLLTEIQNLEKEI